MTAFYHWRCNVCCS